MRPLPAVLACLLACLVPACGLAAAEEAWSQRPVPAEAYARFCRGVALHLQGEHQKALETLQQALELDPRSSTILYQMALCHYRLANNEKAVDYLKRSLELHPGYGPAHKLLAFAYRALGQRSDYLRQLEAAAKAPVRPSHHDRLVHQLAWEYQQQGNHEKALQWYRFYAQCGYRRSGLYRSIGDLELKLGRYEAALESFRRMTRHAEPDQPIVPEVARAFAALSEKQRGEVIRHLEKAVSPDDAAGREVLAMAYLADGRTEETLAAIEAAATHGDRRAEIQSRFLAERFEEAGRYPKAIRWRRRILEAQKTPASEDIVRLAGLYVKHMRLQEAAETYRKALAADPQRRDLLRRIADCHAQLYQWEKAATALEEFLSEEELGPQHAEVVYQLGELYDQAGKDEQAAKHKKQAFELLTNAVGTGDEKSDAAAIYVRLARLYYAEEKPARALGYLVLAQEADPQDHRKLLLVAEGYERVQNWQQAATTYQEYLDRADPEPIPAAGVLAKLATCQESAGRDEEAAASRKQARGRLLKALAASEKDVEKAAIRAQLGEMAFRRNRVEAALEHFLEALRLNPKQHLFHLYLAECFHRLGDPKRAAGHYKSFVKTLGSDPDPDDATTIYRLGAAQERAGMAEQSKQNQQRAIQLLTRTLRTLEEEGRGTPAYKAELLRDLASLQASEDEHQKAIETMARAVELAPSGKRTEYTLLLASLHDDLGDYERSEKILLRAYERNPEDPMVLNHLGYFYAERGKKLDQAVRLVQRALRYEPLNGAYVDSLGWAYYQQGKYEQALELLLRAVTFEEDAVIRDHVGDAYFKLDKVEEARQAWQKALQLDPHIEGVREKLEKTQPPQIADPQEPQAP
ncbi:MAG: tetratricopeptide repeat protein [Candidatus Brocadiia bacterium]